MPEDKKDKEKAVQRELRTGILPAAEHDELSDADVEKVVGGDAYDVANGVFAGKRH